VQVCLAFGQLEQQVLQPIWLVLLSELELTSLQEQLSLQVLQLLLVLLSWWP
jgi:hypothetical protein